VELRLESSLLEKTPSPGSACKGVLQSSDAAQLGAELESLSASWPGQRAPQVWQPPRLADHAAGLVKFERGRAVWRGPRNAIKHHEPQTQLGCQDTHDIGKRLCSTVASEGLHAPCMDSAPARAPYQLVGTSSATHASGSGLPHALIHGTTPAWRDNKSASRRSSIFDWENKKGAR